MTRRRFNPATAPEYVLIIRAQSMGGKAQAEDGRLSVLEDRRTSLEKTLQQEVKDKLGVDYAVLWHAVTPSGPVPKL